MLTKLFEYQGAQVRVVMIDGEPWWVASDVAKVLGYRDAQDTVRGKLRPNQKGTHLLRTLGGAQRVTVINEAGVNRLVMRSKRPEAEAFQDWIEGEVIPSLMRSGTYAVPGAQAAALLDDPEAVLKMALQECQRRKAAEAKVIEVSAERDEARQIAEERKEGDDAWQTLAQAKGTYSQAEAAGILLNCHGIKTGEQIIKQDCIRWGMLNENGTVRYKHKKHLTLQPRTYTHPHTGERVRGAPQLRFTHKGLGYVLRRYQKELEEAKVKEAMAKAEQLTLERRGEQARGGAFGSCEVPAEPQGRPVTPEEFGRGVEELKKKLEVVK